MKVLIIYERKKQNTLHHIIKIVSNTLKELQVEVEEILLDEYNIPYYNGDIHKDAQQIASKIKEADAVVFGLKVVLMAPSGVFKVFFEHLAHSAYKNLLKDKYGFCIGLTNTTGERETVEYVLRIWEMLGGIEGGRMALFASSPKEIEAIKEPIEKRIEDFYRIVRQARQKLPTSDRSLEVKDGPFQETMKGEIQKAPEKKIAPRFEAFSQQQEKDIQELTEYFKQQLSGKQPETNINPYGIYEKPSMQPVAQSGKTCRQMTRNLPHYFQPHLAANFKGTFQFHINGKESFEAYITIDNGECSYFEGVSDQADIVMIMNEEVWMDILKGKLSAQKGFMTGQLKVRGNFMILNKLDQFFKKM
ncbi:MAG: hypothetical protein GX209_00450 [Epulopiscium sp.]|nr:hypothetical protein [Candidatus Epulonipiscium sp.]